MINNQPIFKDILLRIVWRNHPNQQFDNLDKELALFTSSWEEAEKLGSLCVDETTGTQIDELINSDLANVYAYGCLGVDESQGTKPFVIDKKGDIARIYTNRTFMQETSLAHKLISLAFDEETNNIATTSDSSETASSNVDSAPDRWQEAAIKKSLNNRLSIISGGPGTGKTRTVRQILEVILAKNNNALIYLAAPTGKARNKLADEIKKSPLCSKHKGQIISNTIHGWLTTNTSANSKPSETNPLECNVLVVDEASMISSEIAYSFFKVINSNKTQHVILLGDMNQLQAVEPGNVYAVVSDENGALREKVTVLRKNHRTEGKGIGELACAIQSAKEKNEEDFRKAVWDVIDKDEYKEDLFFHDKSSVANKVVRERIGESIANYVKSVNEHLCHKDNPSEEDLWAVWIDYSSFRFIAASRHGSGGVEEINTLCGEKVSGKTNLNKEENYQGKPIIVLKNDSSIGVANGDSGFIYYSNTDKNWHVYFGGATEASSKIIPLSLLPSYDTAFAITIHKSQGSEFDKVMVFLPDNIKNIDDNRWNLATRELLYTAITRAKKYCGIFGPKEFFNKCLINPTRRVSGLADRLDEFKQLREKSSRSGADQNVEQPTEAV